MNQCDGCRRGLPIEDGIHLNPDDPWDGIGCTKERYDMKPIILWTADTKGWAYHNRIVTMDRAMGEYDHRILMGEHVPPSLWWVLAMQASVIVCQGIKWPERLAAIGIDKAKMVLRLDSMRIDINGIYYDIFKATTDGAGTQES